MFADDSSLFSSGPNLKNIETTMNNEIPNLVTWLRANRLSLNIDKTHIMIFGPNTKSKLPDINVTIEGTPLDIVQTTKFLGLILDSGLTWKPHITAL